MTYDVRIAPPESRAVFDLQGAQADLAAWAGDALPAFPEAPLTASGGRLLWLGPESWLLVAPLEEEDALTAALRPEEAPPEISIVPVSDSLLFLGIGGPDAADILAMAGPLDVHPRAFPETGATWGEVFGQRGLILRRTGGSALDGIDRGGIDRGGIDRGGIDRGGIDRGGIERGGVEPGGFDLGVDRSYLPMTLDYLTRITS